MNEVFKNRDFWIFYKTLENNGESDYNNYLNLFKQDFEIKDTESVRFSFDCGSNYSILLDLTFDKYELYKNIYLKNKNTEYLLGWWDQAHWHPYFLRYKELELLTNYWQKNTSKWDIAIPFLLLSDFVGITEAHEGEILRKNERVLFEQLGAYNDEFKAIIYPDGKQREEYLKEGKYEWKKDSELGWLFTSPEYPCYSLRNKEHIKSNCGSFPFEHWNNMNNEIQNII